MILDIEVDIDETVVMLFRKGTRTEGIELVYNNCKLKVVREFTYLGVTLTSNCCSYKAQKRLSELALKAVFSLQCLFDCVSLKVDEKFKLFDSMVLPILCYGSEIWGFHKAPDIERVHIRYLKQILSVRQQTTNAAVYGEVGRFPLNVVRNVRLLSYWLRVSKHPQSLPYKLYSMTDQDGQFILKWSRSIKKLLDELGFSVAVYDFNFATQNFSNIVSRIYAQYVQSWFSIVENSSKLETYAKFKCSFESEKYLTHIDNTLHRIALTRLRCSAHNLAIEDGRFRNIVRENRK